MRLSQVSFVFRRVFGSLRELLWTHILTLGSMAATLFVFGGFILIQENLHGLLRGWGSQLQIFAYLEDGLTRSDLESIQRWVRSHPEVEGVRYVSKKEAWETFKKDLGTQSGVLEGLDADLLPSSLEIEVKKPYRQRASVEGLAHRLKGMKGIGEVEYAEEWMEKLSLLLLTVQWAKWIFGGFLFMASLLIVGSTVKLSIMARKDEIEIMQLVGATGGMIKAPFVIEGIIQGLVGASFSLFFLWLLFFFLSVRLPSSLGILMPKDQLHFLNLWQASFLLLLGWVLGAAGSLFSLRRFLRT
ncbi:MAG: cell division protein FtsX [Candidatus Binatia bacterium]